jgi:DNA-binding MarR family transcriptional regulator
MRVARGISRIEREQICCETLTYQQFATLKAVQKARTLSTTALARKLGVDLSTASRNLALIEKQGLVQRVRSAEDGRVVTVKLSAKGTRTLKSLHCDERVVFDKLLAHIPTEKREDVCAALLLLVKALEYDDDAPACCPAPTGISEAIYSR